MHLPDRAGPWTLEEVLALGEDTSHRVEMIGGALLLTPRPGVPHQRAVRRLASLLDAAAEDDVEVLTSVNINLAGRALVTPDITVVHVEAAHGDNAFLDAADVVLAVEVTTADTEVTDRITRPALYATAGIPHHWRLNIAPAPHLWTGTLQDGAYATTADLPAGRTGRVEAPFQLHLDPAGIVRPASP
ncbi:Uma2 family endonuclease (plasmid) [Streptomyces sp. SDT5-1]|uniref:Uma2 family endonuclease n=1 Tax=Streptomyces sp. SDT5-1 TaxID=3406418 RepID=UPI003FD3F3C9